MTSRSYCFTAFNESKWEITSEYRYLIVGTEKCPTTGRLHYQCYIEFSSPVRPGKIKKIFNDKTIHVETRRGTREQAREYCMKDGNYQEFGNWSAGGQGTRNDLKTVITALKDGTRLSDIMMEEPELYCRYRNGLKDIAANVIKSRTSKFRHVEVEVILGDTGLGKTRGAVESCGDTPYFMIHGDNMKWWNGYDDEKILIIDEYSNDVPITTLLSLLDGYQKRLEVKGGFTYANWEKVIITTNLKRHELHGNAKPAHIAALNRRITKWTDLWELSPSATGNTSCSTARTRLRCLI